jgi:predicted nucleic acid-binding protein
LASDAHHAASSAWLTRHIRDGRVSILPSLALVEIAGVLNRRTGDRAFARRSIHLALALPNVRVVEPDGPLMWRASLLAATLGLRGADAVYVATAYQDGAPLVTWDADQRRRAGMIVAAHSPLTDPF